MTKEEVVALLEAFVAEAEAYIKEQEIGLDEGV